MPGYKFVFSPQCKNLAVGYLVSGLHPHTELFLSILFFGFWLLPPHGGSQSYSRLLFVFTWQTKQKWSTAFRGCVRLPNVQIKDHVKHFGKILQINLFSKLAQRHSWGLSKTETTHWLWPYHFKDLAEQQDCNLLVIAVKKIRIVPGSGLGDAVGEGGYGFQQVGQPCRRYFAKQGGVCVCVNQGCTSFAGLQEFRWSRGLFCQHGGFAQNTWAYPGGRLPAIFLDMLTNFFATWSSHGLSQKFYFLFRLKVGEDQECDNPGLWREKRLPTQEGDERHCWSGLRIE